MLSRFPLPPDVRTYYRDTWGAPRARGTRPHRGVDLAAPEGTPIESATSGRVVAVLEDASSSCGLGVQVLDAGQLVTYCHMRAVPLVHEGEAVRPGDLLGFVGDTGNATSPHLHFQVQDARTRAYLNPFEWLRAVDPRAGARAPARARAGNGSGVGWLLLAGLAVFVMGGSK